MTILTRETNHARLQHFAWGDPNENDGFRNEKLIIYGYIILHGGDLNGHDHFEKRHCSVFYLLGSKV